MKKQVLLFPSTLGFSLIAGAAMAQEGFKVVDTIAGTSLKFIQSALPELGRYGYSFKLDECRIIVVKAGGHYAVIFKHKDIPPGRYGSTPDKPVFEVELSEDGTVIRSGFAQ
jgi:hypothetical protein